MELTPRHSLPWARGMPGPAMAAAAASSACALAAVPGNSRLNCVENLSRAPSRIGSGPALGISWQQAHIAPVTRRGLTVCAAKGSKKPKFKSKGSAPAAPQEEDGAEGPGASEDGGDEGEAPSSAKKEKKDRGDEERLIMTASEPVDGKVMVHVKVPGRMTQQSYNRTLVEMAKTCPPVPGARMNKGGKSTKVDTAVVLRLVGKSRIVGFVVNEIVNSALGTFVEERGMNADKEATTWQSKEELSEAFQPGKPLEFDAELILLDAPAEAEQPAPVPAAADA